MVGAASAFDLARDELEVERGIEIEGAAGKGTFARCGGRAGIRGEQRHAIGAHQVTIRIDEHGHAQELLEGVDDADVLAHAALEHGRTLDLLALAHVIQVVGGDRMAQACDDVLARVAHLDLVHEVAFGEHRAARRDVGGFFWR